jgi:Fur family ferric uptake transcriptional regulator
MSTDVLSEVVRRLAEERGFAVDVGHVALSGVCPTCRDEGA